jgi:FMN phosphatase YigB (HAD superfamily)
MIEKGHIMDKVILTDVDGVLLNWEYAFNVWMQRHGYRLGKNANSYDMGERYDLNDKKKRELVKFFNESAAIGYLPPLRDAIHYVRKLHEKHGYVFHVLTALVRRSPGSRTSSAELTKAVR